MADIRIGIMGVGGRMGRELARATFEMSGAVLAGGTEPPGSPLIGHDLGVLVGAAPTGSAVSNDTAAVLAGSDVIVDFTAPAATVGFAKKAADRGVACVIGTTGLTAEHEAAVARAAERVAIVRSGNFSLGVNLLTIMTERIAASLDADFDIEIVEMHHRMKVDAPSGTALMLGEAAAKGRKVSLAGASVRAREGHTGARRRGDIGFQALRGGSVVGEHTVIFAADGERIEITHRAADRGIFARGAIKAALWAHGKPAGLYTMADVLGL